ncbi:IS110 family RNA-guided transposase [Methylocaldum gracile]|uniref:IS110 family transposase n=1 Tax=unclassified Methylocaldum TaxID=2622260 RepID=UPI0010D22746
MKKVTPITPEALNAVVRVGVDLAKSTFAVVAVDRREQVQFKRMLKRADFERFLGCLPAGCGVAMEACSGAHAWARECSARGLQPRLLAPQAVKPYIGEQKNDLRDARGICEAAGRPKIQPIRVKSVAESDLQMVVRVREGRVAARTAKSNQLRGFLAEYGLTLPRGAAALESHVPALLEDAENGLSAQAREVLASLYREWQAAEAEVAEADGWVRRLTREIAASQRLQRIPGIGPIIALALLALLGDGRGFRTGRALAAWLGLTPNQRSTGGKTRLGSITKHGQVYLRTLLIHGARAALNSCKASDDRVLRWARGLAERVGKNRAAVALANKLARVAWRVLVSEAEHRPA